MAEVSFFKPEDFFDEQVHYRGLSNSEASVIANKIIQERGIIVYGYGNGANSKNSLWTHAKESLIVPQTHKALIINIEEIPKVKICDHAAGQITVYQGVRWVESTCLNCGIKLKPGSWVEA